MYRHNMEEDERSTKSGISVKECSGTGWSIPDKKLSSAQNYPVFDHTTAKSNTPLVDVNPVTRQRAGTSVERRPLVLRKTSCVITENHRCTDNEETSLNGAPAIQGNNLTQLGSLNKAERLPHSDGTLLPFSINTWKNSALSVVETIRNKLNYFRRTQSLEDKSDSEMRFDGVKKDAKKLNNCYDQRFPLQSVEQTTAESWNNRNIDYKKEHKNFPCVKTDNDDPTSGEPLLSKDISFKIEQDKRTELTPDSVESGNLKAAKNTQHTAMESQLSDWTVLEGDANHTVQEKIPVTNASCSGTTLCVPCIGSRKSNEDVLELPGGASLDKSSVEISDSESLTLSKESSPKVVHQQPVNSPSCEKLCAEAESELFKVEEHKKLFSSFRSNAITLIQGKDIRQNNNHDSSISSESSATSSEAVKALKTEERHQAHHEYEEQQQQQQHINDHPSEVIPDTQQTKIHSTKDSERMHIDLWNLRNSLEQRETEVSFHAPTYGYFDNDSNCRSISNSTTGGMTEESPLTTPSSEPIISRERSMSDSDEENRAFIITASGRISPRLPNCYRRRSSGFSSSPEHGFEKSQNTELCVPEKTTITTTATVEHPSSHLYSNDILSFGNNKLPKKNTSVDSSPCYQRRQKYMSSQKWSTLDRVDISEKLTVQTPPKIKKQVTRQMSLPLSVQHQSLEHSSSLEKKSSQPTQSIIRFVADEDIKEVPLYQTVSATDVLQTNSAYKNCITDLNAKSRRKAFLSSDSNSLDDVFYNDNEASWMASKTLQDGNTTITEKTSKKEENCSMESQSKQPRSFQTRAAYSLTSVDTTPVPPTHRHELLRKYHTKPASVNSSGETSPVSPSGGSSMVSTLKYTRSVDLESDDSVSSQTSSGRSSRSSSSLKSISRLFRRSNKHHRQRSDSAPTFYGYTMNRDYCVDIETDRIFKEFLCQDSPTHSLSCGEVLPPPSHMVPPPPLHRQSGGHLRGQVLRKQYSDSIAMYYGQRQRRWRFSKQQKSDSVNCPVDRGVFRRQDRIEEEFDPEEINERLSSTSSRRDSERPDFIPPTVTELKEWRSNSEDRTPVLRQTNSLLSPSFHKEFTPSTSQRSTRHVTFKGGQDKDDKMKSHDNTS